MLWKRLLVGLLCVPFLLFCSCERKSADTAELLSALMEGAGELPQGRIYQGDAEEGSDAYLSPSLREAMYGAESKEIFSLMEGYSIYLSSFAAPFEIAVFRVYSASDAETVAAMCLGRADELRVLLRQTELRELGESVRILLRGRTVIMGVTEDADAFEREALRLTR